MQRNDYSNAYNNVKILPKCYYDDKNRIYIPIISKNEFRDKHPVYVIDCSKQNDTIKESSVSTRVDMTFAKDFPSDMSMHCIVVCKRAAGYDPLHNIISKDY